MTKTKIITKANPGKDPQLIQIGDSIKIPTSAGMMVYVAEKWIAGNLADKSCFWKMAELSLKGELPVVQMAPKVPVAKHNPITLQDWLWLILFLAVCLLAFSIYKIWKWYSHQRRERNLDPFRRAPVLQDGLSENLVTATGQIEEAYSRAYSYDPNRIIRRVTRGKVDRTTGNQDFLTTVASGDGWIDARIKSGTRCYQVVVGRHDQPDPRNDRVEYYLSHCGNIVAEVRGGQFNLPEGWVFVADATTGGESATYVPQPSRLTRQENAAYRYGDLRIESSENGGVRVTGSSDRFISSVIKDGNRIEVQF